MMHWGADSFLRADQVVTNPSNRPTPRHGADQIRHGNEMLLYDYVVRRVGGGEREPEFWGRYLTPTSHARAGARLTEEEQRFIHARGCKILLVYNGIDREMGRLKGEPALNAGFLAGTTAIELARGLNVPPGIRIYADLEGWNFSPNWIRGWWLAMHDSEYAGMGGLYGRGAEIRLREIGRTPPRYPAGTWSANFFAAASRQQERQILEEIHYIWSNMPRGPRRRHPPGEFQGVGPPGSIVAIWQYCMNYLTHPRVREIEEPDGRTREVREEVGLVDLDVATELGFRDMWAGAGRSAASRPPGGTGRLEATAS